MRDRQCVRHSGRERFSKTLTVAGVERLSHCVWHTWYLWHDSFTCVKLLIHALILCLSLCMTHSHGAFICVIKSVSDTVRGRDSATCSLSLALISLTVSHALFIVHSHVWCSVCQTQLERDLVPATETATKTATETATETATRAATETATETATRTALSLTFCALRVRVSTNARANRRHAKARLTHKGTTQICNVWSLNVVPEISLSRES